MGGENYLFQLSFVRCSWSNVCYVNDGDIEIYGGIRCDYTDLNMQHSVSDDKASVVSRGLRVFGNARQPMICVLGDWSRCYSLNLQRSFQIDALFKLKISIISFSIRTDDAKWENCLTFWQMIHWRVQGIPDTFIQILTSILFFSLYFYDDQNKWMIKTIRTFLCVSINIFFDDQVNKK